MAAIKIENLSYYYPESQVPALDRINLEIPPGQFVLLVGGSGSGKSTLLRAISGLIPGFYKGRCTGAVYLDGKSLQSMSRRSQISKVGMLFQDPENQMIMNSVEKEIVFGMENMGLAEHLMKRRVVEVSSALNLTGLFKQFVAELSGGQKQKVALASILSMHPEILILDEPTSRLDPVAAEEILSIIRRLNEENGTTVILVEQRLERCFPLADRVLAMEHGKIVNDHYSPEKLVYWAVKKNYPFIPPMAKLFASCDYPEVPATVKEGRQMLGVLTAACHEDREFLTDGKPASDITRAQKNRQVLAELNNIWFSYPGGGEVLKNVNLTINAGDFIAIMGDNGAGKTTLLKHINGLLKPGRGRVKVLGEDTRYLQVEELARSVAYLSQDPNDYLFLSTVREELDFSMKNLGLTDDGYSEELLGQFHLLSCQESNPRDLSVGERQRVALASVLVSKPSILLLDEPTRGLDYQLKEELGQILLGLKAEGVAIIMITHDIEFAAEYVEDIVLMSEGTIVAQGSKYDILSHSTFYSPQIGKLFNNLVDGVLTLAEGQDVLNRLLNMRRDEAISV